MKIWAWAAAVGSVVALFACGGGGNGNTGGDGTGGNPTTSVSSSSGVTTSSTGTGGMTGCGSHIFNADADVACQDCGETNCCAELLACDVGTECDDLFGCIAGCTDDACVTDCIQNQFPGGAPDAQALVTCMTGPQGGTGACNTECSTGVICDSGLQIKSNPACGDCLGAQCCTEYTACVNDTGTPTCIDCITGKTETGCDMNTTLAAANTCRTTKCSDVCGGEICDTGLSTGAGKCDSCLGSKCCDVIKACQNDTACFNNCLSTNMPAASCATDTKYQAVKTCWNTNCAGMNDCGNML